MHTLDVINATGKFALPPSVISWGQLRLCTNTYILGTHSLTQTHTRARTFLLLYLYLFYVPGKMTGAVLVGFNTIFGLFTSANWQISSNFSQLLLSAASGAMGEG